MDTTLPATPQDHFAGLRDAAFLLLTTYRPGGAAVPTTVWFAEVDGTIYITTLEELGKVRRIRANPAVLVAPSDRVGNPHGPAVAARARVLPPELAPAAEAALRQKYGAQYDSVIGQMGTGRARVFLELTPA